VTFAYLLWRPLLPGGGRPGFLAVQTSIPPVCTYAADLAKHCTRASRLSQPGAILTNYNAFLASCYDDKHPRAELQTRASGRGDDGTHLCGEGCRGTVQHWEPLPLYHYSTRMVDMDMGATVYLLGYPTADHSGTEGHPHITCWIPFITTFPQYTYPPPWDS